MIYSQIRLSQQGPLFLLVLLQTVLSARVPMAKCTKMSLEQIKVGLSLH